MADACPMFSYMFTAAETMASRNSLGTCCRGAGRHARCCLAIIMEAAASAAEVPMRGRVPELHHEHEAALVVRGDGDIKLCPAALTDDSPPLCLCVVIYGLPNRLQNVNELSVAAVAEGVADKR